MKKLFPVICIFLMVGCSTLSGRNFCYFGQCVSYSKLHPNGSTQEAEKEKADDYGIDVLLAIEPIVQDVLRRDGNYGRPLGYRRPKHHYHFSVLGYEVEMKKHIEKYSHIVRDHSIKNCPNSDSDRPIFMYYNTINKIYKHSYIIGYQGMGADGYGIVRYNPSHHWKNWPELVETGINRIYD